MNHHYTARIARLKRERTGRSISRYWDSLKLMGLHPDSCSHSGCIELVEPSKYCLLHGETDE